MQESFLSQLLLFFVVAKYVALIRTYFLSSFYVTRTTLSCKSQISISFKSTALICGLEEQNGKSRKHNKEVPAIAFRSQMLFCQQTHNVHLKLGYRYTWQLHETMYKLFKTRNRKRSHNVVGNKHCFVKNKSHQINLIMLRDRISNLNGNEGTADSPSQILWELYRREENCFWKLNYFRPLG